MSDGDTRVAFVCVQNAGRSQMAAAFARQQVEKRGLSDHVEVVSGGTDPADRVHQVVVEAMAERGIDISDRIPRKISDEELFDSAVVVTMGCSGDDVCPVHWIGDERDWNLDDPHDRPLAAVRAIRDGIEGRVEALLDEMANADE